MIAAFTFLFTLVSAALGAPAGAAITAFTLNGSGCPAGSTTSSVSGDSVNVEFTQFTSSVGPSSNPLAARANCQASIQVNVPKGLQFAPRDVIYSGSVVIPSQVTASRSSLYYFQGSTAQDLTSTSANGPLVAQNITVTDTFTGAGGFSPCGTSSIVNINVAINTFAPSNSNAEGMNAVNAAQIGNFIWQAC